MDSTTTDNVSQTTSTLDRKLQTFVSEEGHELLRTEAARLETSMGSIIDALAKANLQRSERASNAA